MKIDPVQHQGKTKLSKLERGGARATASFEFQKLIFIYDKVRALTRWERWLESGRRGPEGQTAEDGHARLHFPPCPQHLPPPLPLAGGNRRTARLYTGPLP